LNGASFSGAVQVVREVNVSDTSDGREAFEKRKREIAHEKKRALFVLREADIDVERIAPYLPAAERKADGEDAEFADGNDKESDGKDQDNDENDLSGDFMGSDASFADKDPAR
jgi:hypothetical protein